MDGVYAVLKKEKLRTRAGAAYLALELSDSTGRISGRVWNDVDLLDARFSEGDAVHVLGRVEKFRDRLQLEVRALEPAEADPASLAPALRRDADELEGFVEFLTSEIHDEALRGLVGRVLAERCRSAPTRRRRTVITRTRAGCSSTPSASQRYAARSRSSIRACARTCSSGRHSSTTSGARGSSARRLRSGRPRTDGCSATCTSAFACSRPRRAPAELLHAVAVHHDLRAARTAEAAVLFHANQLDSAAATKPVPG